MKPIAVLLALPLFYVAWLAINWGIADRYAYDARQLEKQWKKNDNFSQAVLQEAITGTKSAVKRAPDHPEYRDQLARLLILQLLMDRKPSVGEEAKEHLLHSRKIRPYWGSNWASHAELKHYLREIDDDLFQAIEKATRHGPWEAAVLQAITRVGVANYSSLPVSTQGTVIANIDRGLKSPVPSMPARILVVMEQEYKGWTLEFTSALAEMLTTGNWVRRSYAVNIKLSYRLWPLLTQAQRKLIVTQTVTAIVDSNGTGLLNLTKRAGKLTMICPRLPREDRFRRICRKAL
ncbi:MAG: hypothetical protein HOC70_04960 [Gammaproteobacteria bacterium]|mgnify:CR=1 FL=1|jgi:hypothetical protein|nr:hypothetical protein [Gammaproteobacteria bacterium]MBT4492573.1 hypothetical protein [Gammaproteobacteria bacterium]MBT7371049.1 hypothetical protein [Gammaproteobacteria bacterium]